MEHRPVFKTFAEAEGLKEWALWVYTGLALIFYGHAAQPTRLARRKALEILSVDCANVKRIYRQAALDFFPRTREDAANPEYQANAVAINGAYEKRQQGSCRPATRNRSLSEEVAEEVKKEAEEEEPEAEEEEPEAEEEEPEAEEEAPPKFSIGERLFQWVKWTSVGIGLGGTTLYVAKECRKVGRKRIPHPASPGRRNRRAYSLDSE